MTAAAATSIRVTWDPFTRQPRAFVWRTRRWRIERVLHSWVVDSGWWDDRRHVSRYYSRVLAEGRVFDLYFDRGNRGWFLEKALN